MSKLYTLLFVLFTLLPLSAKGRTQSPVQVQPAFWWSGMVNPTLQLVLHGHNKGIARLRSVLLTLALIALCDRLTATIC